MVVHQTTPWRQCLCAGSKWKNLQNNKNVPGLDIAVYKSGKWPLNCALYTSDSDTDS